MPLQTDRPKAQYNCGQEELYAVAILGWNSYLDNVPDFTNHLTTYTLAYGNAQKAAVTAASDMPDAQQRDEISESFRILLEDEADKCLIQWKNLESYILHSFPEKLHKAKLEGAGSTHYDSAANNNWDEVDALMKSGKKFITDNNAKLTTGGMPAAFPATFNTVKTDFEKAFTDFEDAQQDNEEIRDAKINANNALHDSLTSMFDDGQKIYRNNAAKRDRFTFSTVLSLVSGAGLAGVKGTCSPDSAVSAGITIKCVAQNKSTTADDTGKYTLNLQSGDNIAVDYSAPGFVSKTITLNISVGTMSTQNITLIPAPPPPQPPIPA
ncbi:MAG: carboxypeptidase regulatory-like domain-containing protein [Bacteroidetes bacterium]|nr:carboxypeptidase regulatory-like domain-containing protein [Bacteroidota bacterium]